MDNAVERVQAVCSLLEERADDAAVSHPNVSAALRACVLMVIDAACDDGLELDVQALGFVDFGVIDED
jgi:hypothetical protein